MPYYDHEFTGVLAVHHVGTLEYRAVFLPPGLYAVVGDGPGGSGRPVRMEGEVADVPVRAAWQRAAGGRRYVMLSRAFCRAAGLRVGDQVTVRFRVVGSDDVAVPEELAALLAADAAARRGWEATPPGLQRGLAHHVNAGRRAETRARRAEAVAAKLRDGPAAR